MEKRQATSPFRNVRRRLPKFSVRTILLIMFVFAIASTVFVAALRTGPVANEIAMLTGRPAPGSTGGHFSHLIFLLLCYCSTMLLALMVQVAKYTAMYFSKIDARKGSSEGPIDPFAD